MKSQKKSQDFTGQSIHYSLSLAENVQRMHVCPIERLFLHDTRECRIPSVCISAAEMPQKNYCIPHLMTLMICGKCS